MNGRYSRQTLLPWLGEGGQGRLASSSAAIVGVGALGCVAADYLARAGVGRLVLVDRDHVEESNLTRQTLFSEADARERLPKAVAARERLLAIRPDLVVEAHDADLDGELARSVAGSADLLVDGTDNFETRYLINDAAVWAGKPWVYGGAVSGHGSVLAVRPGATACLRCLFPDCPPPGGAPTCDTVGVLGPVAGTVAALQAGEALKLLAGRPDLCPGGLLTVDLMAWTFTRVEAPRNPACPCCAEGRYEFLDEAAGTRTHRVCGRDGILVLAPKGTRLDLASLRERLRTIAPVFDNPYLLQTEWEGYPVTLYADGRALVQKTDDPARARALYARYLGM